MATTAPSAPPPGRSTVYAPHGVVATSQPLATGAALHVLQQGGNAVDACVTAAAVLAVVEPHMTGMGGDLFALLWSADQRRLLGLDASGRAGALMTPERIRAAGHAEVPSRGAASVTLPGSVAGWAALLESHGTLPLAEALRPAVALARDGFPVTPVIARQWAAAVPKLLADAGARATFLLDGRRAPRAGEWFRNPDLAASLAAVAEEGAAAMYGGGLGRAVVDGVGALGGWLTAADLAGYRPDWIEPISMDYKGVTLWELPPAGQGLAALQMLGMAKSFDLASMGWNSAAYLHTLVELKKLAFADLARCVGDRDCMRARVSELLDPDYLSTRAARIDPRRAAERAEPGADALGHGIEHAPDRAQVGVDPRVAVDGLGGGQRRQRLEAGVGGDEPLALGRRGGELLEGPRVARGLQSGDAAGHLAGEAPVDHTIMVAGPPQRPMKREGDGPADRGVTNVVTARGRAPRARPASAPRPPASAA